MNRHNEQSKLKCRDALAALESIDLNKRGMLALLMREK